eukprot:GDKJ01011646.1.p1 GENE.GDKJ01011646.1~~GDKJ01011646.1.p1  ORF type:complete len:145 (+),score=35.93 GDKJ01011646.1:1-435(+)
MGLMFRRKNVGLNASAVAKVDENPETNRKAKKVGGISFDIEEEDDVDLIPKNAMKRCEDLEIEFQNKADEKIDYEIEEIKEESDELRVLDEFPGPQIMIDDSEISAGIDENQLILEAEASLQRLKGKIDEMREKHQIDFGILDV